THLQSGMTATKLGLTWNDRISFVLTAKLQLKRLEFLHVEKENADGQSEITPEAQFDMDFTLMAGELSQLLSDLAQPLGAEAQRHAASASSDLLRRAGHAGPSQGRVRPVVLATWLCQELEALSRRLFACQLAREERACRAVLT